MAVIHNIDFTPVVGHLTNSAIFEAAYTAWEADGHTAETRDTFAAALLFPLINLGRGIAPPYASMSPAEVAREVMKFCCASKYAIDREV